MHASKAAKTKRAITSEYVKYYAKMERLLSNEGGRWGDPFCSRRGGGRVIEISDRDEGRFMPASK